MKIRHIHFKETGSTNQYLRENLSRYEDENILVSADFQTSGRGQGTNTWESERGRNLLFSLLVHPRFIPPERQFLLSEMQALAQKEVLDGYTAGISLKWPNDIYWKDKKLGGTLIETSVNSRGVRHCIFGTGINVNQREFRGDAPNPVSLYQILGHETERGELLEKLIEAFGKYVGLIASSRFQDISRLYHVALFRGHGFHEYRDKDGIFEAAVVEVEDDGHLILRDREGKTRGYMFKEVEHVL